MQNVVQHFLVDEKTGAKPINDANEVVEPAKGARWLESFSCCSDVMHVDPNFFLVKEAIDAAIGAQTYQLVYKCQNYCDGEMWWAVLTELTLADLNRMTYSRAHTDLFQAFYEFNFVRRADYDVSPNAIAFVRRENKDGCEVDDHL